MSPVAALFVRADGPYSTLPGVEAWDSARDARRYAGPWPIVAHPPCGPWGRYAHRCEQDPSLALWAVEKIWRWGGILEHPAGSRLWEACRLAAPGGLPDSCGWTLEIEQSAWGHRAPKPTWLYLCGIDPGIVALPPAVPDPGGRVERLSRRQRELTPPALAAWLVALARQAEPARRAA